MSEAELLELVESLCQEAERGARFIRHHHKNPAALRAWAARIESNMAPNCDCLPARCLESAAAEARRLLTEDDNCD